jgi:hypothetical protein
MSRSVPDRKLIYFIAMSVAGYIAGETGRIELFSATRSFRADHGNNEFINAVDTIFIRESQ